MDPTTKRLADALRGAVNDIVLTIAIEKARHGDAKSIAALESHVAIYNDALALAEEGRCGQWIEGHGQCSKHKSHTGRCTFKKGTR